VLGSGPDTEVPEGRRESRVEAGSGGSGSGRSQAGRLPWIPEGGQGRDGTGRWEMWETGPQAQALSCPDPMGTLDPVSRATFTSSPGA